MLMRLMSKGEYLIVPKGTKFKGSGKLGLIIWHCTKLGRKWCVEKKNIVAHSGNKYIPIMLYSSCQIRA